jgi:predicted protein tyrosine phosphatase
MIIEVMNRMHAEAQVGCADVAVISISKPGDPANLNSGWLDILRLEFHDSLPGDDPKVDEFEQVHRNGVTHLEVISSTPLQLFTKEQAQLILEFIERHGPRDYLIHCDAGISRSVAVGMFIEDFFDKDIRFVCAEDTELILHEIHTTAAHNSHVLGTLNRILWKRAYGSQIE